MTTDQVLTGASLILALAVGSQVLASRLRIPALIILLPAGFTAGTPTTDVNPDRLLGAAFEPLVKRAAHGGSGPASAPPLSLRRPVRFFFFIYRGCS